MCDGRALFFHHVEGKRICLKCADSVGITECDHHPDPCGDGSWQVNRPGSGTGDD